GVPGTAQNTQNTGQRGATGAGGAASSGTTAPGATSTQTGSRGLSPIGTQGGGTGIQTTAGISGVTSKSKDQSIRLYTTHGHHHEWAFVYTPQLHPGQGAPGSAGPGPPPRQPRAPPAP